MGATILDLQEDDGRPRALLAGLPSDVLTAVGCIAIEASLIEEVVERALLSLAKLPEHTVRVAFGELGFAQKWQRCWRLASEAGGVDGQFLRIWLPRAQEAMRDRNKILHHYWYQIVDDQDKFYAYGSPLRGRSKLATRDDFIDVLTSIRTAYKTGQRLTQWTRGIITADELLDSLSR